MLTLGFQSNNYEVYVVQAFCTFIQKCISRQETVCGKKNLIETVVYIMQCDATAPVKAFRNGQSNISLFQTVVIYECMHFWQHWCMSFSKGVANELAYILTNTAIESCMTQNISFIVQQTVEFIYKIKTAVPCLTTRWEQITIENLYLWAIFELFFPAHRKIFSWMQDFLLRPQNEEVG